MNDLSGRADRQSPKWSRPLAPLPDWMESVEALIREQQSRATQRPRCLASSPPQQHPGPASVNHRQLSASWLARWRERHELEPAEAARLLGYANADEILWIERGLPIKRNPERQMQLVLERAPDAASNRSQWLRSWRLRMGFSFRYAIHVLGYGGTFTLYQAEKGGFRPSWEKLLIALAEERCAREAVENSPTDVRLLSNTV